VPDVSEKFQNNSILPLEVQVIYSSCTFLGRNKPRSALQNRHDCPFHRYQSVTVSKRENDSNYNFENNKKGDENVIYINFLLYVLLYIITQRDDSYSSIFYVKVSWRITYMF